MNLPKGYHTWIQTPGSGVKVGHANTGAAQRGAGDSYLGHAWGDGGSCDEDHVGSKLGCPEDL